MEDGCIFYSRAVCLVRDEYERIESKEFQTRKGEARADSSLGCEKKYCDARVSLISRQLLAPLSLSLSFSVPVLREIFDDFSSS